MSELYVPIEEEGIVNLYKVECSTDRDRWVINGVTDGPLEKKYRSYYRKDIQGQLTIVSEEKGMLEDVSESVSSITLGTLCSFISFAEGRKFAEKWDGVVITGDIVAGEDKAFLRSVEHIEAKYKGLQEYAHRKPGKYLFIYVNNEKKVEEKIDKNIEIRQYTEKDPVDKVLADTFVSEYDLRQKKLLQTGAERMWGYVENETYRKAKDKALGEQWKGFVIEGEGEQGKTALAYALCRYLMNAKKIYGPIWISIRDNPKLYELVKKELEQKQIHRERKVYTRGRGAGPQISEDTLVDPIAEYLLERIGTVFNAGSDRGKIKEYIDARQYMLVLDNLEADVTDRILEAIRHIQQILAIQLPVIVTTRCSPNNPDVYVGMGLTVLTPPMLTEEETQKFITRIIETDESVWEVFSKAPEEKQRQLYRRLTELLKEYPGILTVTIPLIKIKGIEGVLEEIEGIRNDSVWEKAAGIYRMAYRGLSKFSKLVLYASVSLSEEGETIRVEKITEKLEESRVRKYRQIPEKYEMKVNVEESLTELVGTHLLYRDADGEGSVGIKQMVCQVVLFDGEMGGEWIEEEKGNERDVLICYEQQIISGINYNQPASLLDGILSVYTEQIGIERLREKKYLYYVVTRVQALDYICLLVDKYGFDVNSRDEDGLTPLHLAVLKNSNVEVIKCLIEYGADVRAVTEEGGTLLHLVAGNNELSVVKYVLSLGFDITDRDGLGWTPLHCAVRFNINVEVIKCLIEYGADIRSVTQDGKNLLHLVAFNNELSIVKYVLSLGFDITDRDGLGWTPLHCAVRFNINVEVIKCLIEYGADIKAVTGDGKNLLHLVAYNNELSVVKYVLSLGFDITDRDGLGWTPLHIAVGNNNNIEVIKCLIECGADIRSVTQDGKNLLHLVASNQAIAIVKYILSLGLDINSTDKDGWTPLQCAAVENDNVEVIKCLIECGADIKAVTKDGLTLLHLVALNNELSVMKYVLSLGFDINSVDTDGLTPLHCAVGNNNNIEVIKCLIECGADIRSVTQDGKNLLHLVAYNNELSIVKYVLSLGFDITDRDGLGWTPLQCAAVENDNVEVIKCLIECGADIRSVTQDGKNLLHLVAYNNELSIVKYVLSLGFDITDRDGLGWTPLQCAAVENDNVEVIKCLIECGADIRSVTQDGKNLLHLVAYNNELSIVKYVLNLGLDINSRDEDGWTPLHLAVRYNDNVEVIKCLIEYGADIKAVTKDGLTLLHLVAYNNELSVVKYVLSLGFDITDRDGLGWTPLHIAVGNNNNVEVIKCLIEYGADIRSVTKDGLTLLHLVAANSEISVVKYVLSLGLDINSTDEEGLTPLQCAAVENDNVEVIKCLIECGADIKAVTKDGLTLLHLVALNNELSVMKYVLSLGFDINSVDTDGLTPLHCAVGNNNNIEVIKCLIECGADIKAVTQDGKNLLHFVAANSEISVVKYVLSLGLDINSTDEEGWTPLHIAVRYNNNVEVIKYLIECGADTTIKINDKETVLQLAMNNHNSAIYEYLRVFETT